MASLCDQCKAEVLTSGHAHWIEDEAGDRIAVCDTCYAPEMAPATTYGRRLTQLRRQTQWSQRDLATAAEIDVARYSKIENQRVKPTVSEHERIMNAIRTPLWWSYDKVCFELNEHYTDWKEDDSPVSPAFRCPR